MTFNINNNYADKYITLEQLTAGLDKTKDKKKIDRITQIFNQYNTNIQNSSEKGLDLDEQVALMNDLHKADGDGKGKDFDGKVSGKGLKKAGLQGEYKAYKDFMEAYNKAVGENNTYELTFKDSTINENALIETLAERKFTVKGKEFTEQYQYIDNNKVQSTFKTIDGTLSYDQFGRLTRQVTQDEQTIIYSKHDSNDKKAQPRKVVIYDKDNNRTALELQQDGIYLNKEDNALYKLNDKAIPEKYTPPEVTEEVPEVIEKPVRPTSRKLVPMTTGWKNQKVKPDANTTAKFNAMSKADEVLAELTANFDGQLDTDKLLKDLVKNNPSVFASDGIIYSDALWEKLDFPKDLSAYEQKNPA